MFYVDQRQSRIPSSTARQMCAALAVGEPNRVVGPSCALANHGAFKRLGLLAVAFFDVHMSSA